MPRTFINDSKGVRDDDYLRWLTSIALVLTKYYCLKKLSILHDLGVGWRHLIISLSLFADWMRDIRSLMNIEASRFNGNGIDISGEYHHISTYTIVFHPP